MDSIDSQTPNWLIEKLSSDYCEVLLLREVEDLSYKEIADVTGTPMGTVMSRPSRARLALRELWLGARRAGERGWNVIAPPACRS
jgi:RNA polymerase sigma-70 factor (ECF subfamily)